VKDRTLEKKIVPNEPSAKLSPVDPQKNRRLHPMRN